MTTHVLAFAVCHSGCSTHYYKHFDWANPGSMVNQYDKALTGQHIIYVLTACYRALSNLHFTITRSNSHWFNN